QAIEALRQAVAATPDYHPNRTMMLANLGVAYLRRFERSGVRADLEQAIEALGQAVAAAPASHADRGMVLPDLGGADRPRLGRGGGCRPTWSGPSRPLRRPWPRPQPTTPTER